MMFIITKKTYTVCKKLKQGILISVKQQKEKVYIFHEMRFLKHPKKREKLKLYMLPKTEKKLG